MQSNWFIYYFYVCIPRYSKKWKLINPQVQYSSLKVLENLIWIAVKINFRSLFNITDFTEAHLLNSSTHSTSSNLQKPASFSLCWKLPHGNEVTGAGRRRSQEPTCFLMTSVACIIQRGGNPWFRASRMACSRVTLRVQLQGQKGTESRLFLKQNHKVETIKFY